MGLQEIICLLEKDIGCEDPVENTYLLSCQITILSLTYFCFNLHTFNRANIAWKTAHP